MGINGTLWGKTNLRRLTKPAEKRILLESASHMPDGFRWHSLLHHMIDVGACANALLQNPIIMRRFKHLTGCKLTPAIRARLVALVMLHDFGKAQSDFQDQIVVGHDDGVKGHVEPWLAALLRAGLHNDDSYLSGISEALRLASMADWFSNKEVPGDDNTDPLKSMLAASTFHHGGRMERSRMDIYDLRSMTRASVFGVHPMDGLRDVMASISDLCADAWNDEVPVPVSGALIHWFSGLVMIADWMGSGSESHLFPYWDGKGTSRQRWEFAKERAGRLMTDIGIPVAATLGTPDPLSVMVDKNGAPLTPRPIQSAMLAVPHDQRMALIEAPTGDGKTEAAIIRYLALLLAGEVDSLYFAVPSRSAGSELHDRIKADLSRVMPNLPDRIIAAVGGKHRDIHDSDAGIPWAAGDARRFMAAPVAIGTIDQAYLSIMKARHADMRSFLLSRSLLVIDEVHAADPYMTELTAALVDRHLSAGGHVLLMSATLGSSARHRISKRGRGPAPSFDEAVNEPYPMVRYGVDHLDMRMPNVIKASQHKRIRLEVRTFDDGIKEAGAAAAAGARVLFIRSTVGDAVETQRTLEAAGVPTLMVGSVPTLHHGRFAPLDREKLNAALLAAIGKGSPLRKPGEGIVCVTTQTGEQSLDLNADLLLTDPCHTDVALQRLGRLHRHPGMRPEGFEDPRCIILDPGPLEEYMAIDGRKSLITRGKPGFGFAYVYRNLLSIQVLLTWAKERGTITIPDDNRPLVEAGSHEGRLLEMAASMGGPWQRLAQSLYGRSAAERQMARTAVIDMNKSFLEWENSFIDERGVSTRLGDATVAIECAAFPAAFGGEVTALHLPFRQALQAAGNVADIAGLRGQQVSEGENGLLIQIGDLTYTYGRYGLLPIRQS